MAADCTRTVQLRTPIEVDESVLARIEERLQATLGHDLALETRIDKTISGATLVLDEARQIRIDPVRPLADLDRCLSALGALSPESSEGQTVREVIRSFEPGSPITVGATNLRRTLLESGVRTVTLVSRTDVERPVVDRLAAKLASAAGRDIEILVRREPRLEDGAVLLIGDDRRIVLDTRFQWVSDIERKLAAERDRGSVGDPTELIREMIASTEPALVVEALDDTGTVQEVGDGIARVSGLRGVGSQEIVEFDAGVFALAFSLNASSVGCILLGPERGIREGSRVRRTGHLLRVPVGDVMLGRVVNALGVPIDGAGPLRASKHAPAERPAPGVVDRQLVNRPLHTGYKVIDALVPLGRGQRELIIGDRKTGKTTLAIDTILSQRETGVFCIYAAIGQKASTVASVVRVLEEHDALEYTAVVASLPGEQPAFRYMTPYTACAIGEAFMDEGRDALVVYDDLSKHAVTYREMSALLERPIGREAYPGDIFYVHSRLLERGAHLDAQSGGGSLTALPILETQAGDISAFIPTNVVSICDGQIFLDSDLFNEGLRPALDVGLSVSRVGGAAQTKPMKQVAGRMRIDLAQFHEMAQFVKFGAEVDAATQRQLTRGERARELLRQPAHAPIRTGLEVASLYAAVEGHLDHVPVDAVPLFERELHRTLTEEHPSLVEELDSPEALDEATSRQLDEAVGRFAAAFGERTEEPADEGPDQIAPEA